MQTYRKLRLGTISLQTGIGRRAQCGEWLFWSVLALGVLYTFFQYANYSIPQDSGSEEGKNILVIPAVWIAGEIVFGDKFFATSCPYKMSAYTSSLY